jgi:ZIP family zinc transporter
LEVLFIDVSGNIGLAFALTAIAGLSTGIGSAIAYFIKKPRMIYLSFSLGFSAGVRIYVSFVELLPKSIYALNLKC